MSEIKDIIKKAKSTLQEAEQKAACTPNEDSLWEAISDIVINIDELLEEHYGEK